MTLCECENTVVNEGGGQVEFRTFERRDLNDVIELCKAEQWESYVSDPERTYRALCGPGVITVVAVEEDDVLGFAQLLTDGAIRAYLANMAVVAGKRRSGIGRRLVREVFARSTAVYIDLLSADGSSQFYEGFEHRQLPGYRLYSK